MPKIALKKKHLSACHKSTDRVFVEDAFVQQNKTRPESEAGKAL
jgi:hypothetical protein